MSSKLRDLNLGTMEDVCTVNQDCPIHKALLHFIERRVSALPVVDSEGRLSWYLRKIWCDCTFSRYIFISLCEFISKNIFFSLYVVWWNLLPATSTEITRLKFHLRQCSTSKSNPMGDPFGPLVWKISIFNRYATFGAQLILIIGHWRMKR